MKSHIILIIGLVFFFNMAFSQTPCSSSLRIQSPACDKPTDAKVVSVTCSALKVQWKGNAGEQYEVKLLTKDDFSKKANNAETVNNFNCDAQGICTATIPVSEGAKVYWTVQAKCITSESRTLFSYLTRAQEVTIPSCIDAFQHQFELFPNPNQGVFNLKFSATDNGNNDATVSIYNLYGQEIFTQRIIAEHGTINKLFQLPQNTPTGIYIARIVYNGNSYSQKMVFEY